jgi:mRNA-degrading endonuclease RelE of RelBE toxin-antitoxin system
MSSRPRWRILVAPRAEKDLLRLTARDQVRVRAALDRLAVSSELTDIKKLQGASGEWRLRVGDLRVRLKYNEATRTILISRVLPRGRAYRD